MVLGEGETAAGQDVLLLQVPEFQDVDLTFDWPEKKLNTWTGEGDGSGSSVSTDQPAGFNPDHHTASRNPV